jgi:4-diphosphocytidyl-2-C-methyl-D-erythritol kinase
MLRALNQWADLGLEASTLHEVALSLGSDCPFFINDGAAFVHGRGENLEHLSAPTWSWRGWHVAVIYPGVHVSTQEAFGALSPSEAPWDLRKLHQTPVTEWAKAGLRNDFQPGVSAQHPEIAAALKLVANGAAYAQMTGTGSAVFGLYPSLEQAMRTADEATIKGWTSWSGTLDR